MLSFFKKRKKLPEFTKEVIQDQKRTIDEVLKQTSDFLGFRVDEIPKFSDETDLLIASYCSGFLAGMFQVSLSDKKMAQDDYDLASLIWIVCTIAIINKIFGEIRTEFIFKNLPQLNGKPAKGGLATLDMAGGTDGIAHASGKTKQYGGLLLHYFKNNIEPKTHNIDEILKAFAMLNKDCPGAAYIFARTLYNLKDLIKNNQLTKEDKINLINNNILEVEKEKIIGDAGLSKLALELTKLTINSNNEKDFFENSKIMEHGKTYRKLQEHDKYPPEDEISKIRLKEQKFSCIEDLIKNIRNDYDRYIEQEPYKKEEYEVEFIESSASLMAMFDLREEANSKIFDKRITELIQSIQRP